MDLLISNVAYIIVCLTGICGFTFNEVPEDTSALLGEPAQLNCSLTCNNDCRGLIWVERATSGGSDVEIYYGEDGTFNNGNPKRNRYAIVPGTTNLLVKEVQESDASRYICRPDRGGGESDVKGAFLTAMGPLNTASNGAAIEGGKASVTCNIKFYKHADFSKTPSLIWDIPGADQTGGVGANDVTRTANFSVDSSDDGRSYRCRVYYSLPPPQYTNEKYALITVHYGPKGIRITTKSHGGLGRMLPGDTLICSASGNPAPAFLWRKLSGSGRPGDLNNEVLVITEDMVGNNTYACVASNILINGAVRSLGKTVIFVVFVPTLTAIPISKQPSTSTNIMRISPATTGIAKSSTDISPTVPGVATVDLVPAVIVVYVICVGLVVTIVVLIMVVIKMRKQFQELMLDRTYMPLKTVQQPRREETEYSYIQGNIKSEQQVAARSAPPNTAVYENSSAMENPQRNNRV